MKNLTLENLARVCGGIYRGAKDAEQKEVDSITLTAARRDRDVCLFPLWESGSTVIASSVM